MIPGFLFAEISDIKINNKKIEIALIFQLTLICFDAAKIRWFIA